MGKLSQVGEILAKAGALTIVVFVVLGFSGYLLVHGMLWLIQSIGAGWTFILVWFVVVWVATSAIIYLRKE